MSPIIGPIAFGCRSSNSKILEMGKKIIDGLAFNF